MAAKGVCGIGIAGGRSGGVVSLVAVIPAQGCVVSEYDRLGAAGRLLWVGHREVDCVLGDNRGGAARDLDLSEFIRRRRVFR